MKDYLVRFDYSINELQLLVSELEALCFMIAKVLVTFHYGKDTCIGTRSLIDLCILRTFVPSSAIALLKCMDEGFGGRSFEVEMFARNWMVEIESESM